MELFEGIITPVITPFRRDAQQSVNEQALTAQINWLIDHGVKGIFVLGSNGEFHVLDHDEKVAVTRCAVKAAAGRVPHAWPFIAIAASLSGSNRYWSLPVASVPLFSIWSRGPLPPPLQPERIRMAMAGADTTWRSAVVSV